MIQTIDSIKLANHINAAWEKIVKADKEPLKVLVQVNTSGEEGMLNFIFNLPNHINHLTQVK